MRADFPCTPATVADAKLAAEMERTQLRLILWPDFDIREDGTIYRRQTESLTGLNNQALDTTTR